jgi:hypothetical protein
MPTQNNSPHSADRGLYGFVDDGKQKRPAITREPLTVFNDFLVTLAFDKIFGTDKKPGNYVPHAPGTQAFRRQIVYRDR